METIINEVKRSRGRPRKYPVRTESTIKRGRGRPRKYPVIKKERITSGEYKAVIRKVDSGDLMRHMFQYFTKLLVLHSELAKEGEKYAHVFNRLKVLDFQMAEVCKNILSTEYSGANLEEKQENQ